MGASAIKLEPVPSAAERRRATALRNYAGTLAELEISARTKIPTLGNREAYLALRAAAEKLDHEMARIECLADEFLELAQAEEEEQSE